MDSDKDIHDLIGKKAKIVYVKERALNATILGISDGHLLFETSRGKSTLNLQRNVCEIIPLEVIENIEIN